ncbi:MAG: T9SS type A sorting domain-containing protein [Chitinophagales bacterium]
MKKTFLTFLSLLTVSFLTAQQADNWYFGVMAGLNFSTTIPTVLTDGTITTPEGTACMSDTAGNLLFYTDGITVWNSQHESMPNGTGLLAGSSSTQAALIAKQPGNDNLYYIFTTDEIGGPFGFRYSIVDINLENGLGDVIEKNILLESFVTEKLTAVTTFDGTKIWIVTHDWGTNTFYAHALTAFGVDTDPVISNTGIVHNTSAIQNTYGQMKFSSLGCKLAVAIGYQDTVEIFDFNISTGLISNPVTIPMPDHVYGLEFSPNAANLYVTCYNPMGTLVQFDLTQGSAEAIISSAIALTITPDLYALQLAVDGKIYIAKSYQPYLAIINDPDVNGSGCDLVENGIYLDPNYIGSLSALGFPNFVQSYFDVMHKGCDLATTDEELPAENQLSAFPNPAEDFLSFSTTSFNAEPVNIFISDVTGRTQLSLNVTGSQSNVKVDVSLLEGGVYLLKAIQEDKVFFQKIMVRRK